MNPELCLDLQIASSAAQLPTTEQLNTWANAALFGRCDSAELSVRIVDEEESQALNQQYRHKNSPTNVLSFPADLPDDIEIPLLGDLVICAPIVANEASQQGKQLDAHWAHMIIHGTLHLLGYDHIDDSEANIMEQLETDILTGLGFAPPYEN